jgi:hypothetical protein
MSKNIFISYSRRDQEFVTRLAADLNAQVAGVWFDQSAIQAGEKWHDEIMEGIRECKAFILVLSPDAAESKYVREEINKALELGKTIFPIVYRHGRWSGELQELVKEIQTLDLRSGSYTYNFQKLVDGLIEAGAVKTSQERPFLRQPANTPLNIVFGKIPGWAFAWSVGWLAFWLVVVMVLAFVVATQGGIKGEDVLNFILILICGALGGFAGGLLAGLFTMLSLRPNAPSISWKHMSPTIRIWGLSGPLGMVVSGLITAVLLGIGIISFPAVEADCSGVGLGECLGQIVGTTLAGAFVFALIILLVFAFFVVAAWFLTGMFAGWQVTRHIRRLEPGITTRQAWGVSTGWGCGAILAAVSMFILLAMISSALKL